jgi:hypothetical protein
VQVPVPPGTSAPSQLALASSGAGQIFAAFTVALPGGRTQVFVSRMQDAGCAVCTLQFEPPVPAGPGTQSEELPRVAAGRSAGSSALVAVSFVRPNAAHVAQVWVAQATSGSAALALRPLLVAENAAEEPSPLAFFSDGSLSLAYGRLTDLGQPDAGTTPAPEVADVVVRRLSLGAVGLPVLVNDDPNPADSTHWLPDLAIDLYDRLWVAWYDTRFGAPGDGAWGPGPLEPAHAGSCTAVVMFARSDDKGATFKPNGLVTPDGMTVPFDPVPDSLPRERAHAPLGPVSVTAADTELLVGYTDVVLGTGRAQLAEGPLP